MCQVTHKEIPIRLTVDLSRKCTGYVTMGKYNWMSWKITTANQVH
jgi:hypothetical protein